MRVAIAGSSSLLGQALVPALRAAGHDVLRLVRGRADGPDERLWDQDAGRIFGPGLSDVDAVVNLAGSRLTALPWTPSRKEELRRSRVTGTLTIVAHLEPDGRCQRFLNGSSVTYYGDRGEQDCFVWTPKGEGFLAEVMADAEAAARHSPVPTALLRSGVPLTPVGYLPHQRLAGIGLGGRLGDGRQYVSWIHPTDWTRAVDFLLADTVEGPVNLTAPHPVTNAEWTVEFARARGRRPGGAIPPALVRAVYGREFADTLLLGGVRALPAVLTDLGFTWWHPGLPAALADVVGAGRR